jgi:molybdenum cofactor synthesis domain-containing protein
VDAGGGMHPLKDLVTLERALSLITSSARAVEGVERVEVAAAAFRVLAEDVRAPEDAPNVDRSKMDGYAVTSPDLTGLGEGRTRRLKLAGRSLAGAAFGRALEPGSCAEIATGAALPMGADAVVPVEDTRPVDGGEAVEFLMAAPRHQFISRRGSDFRAGDVLLRAGEVLTPAKLAAAASANAASLSVRARPRVAIFPTGDEVRPQGEPLADGDVRESNSLALAAFIAARGCAPERQAVVRDTPEAVREALARVASFDAAVFTGGSSAGSRDFLARALAEQGSVVFHGVRLRPGKPVLFGRASEKPVLGLPGNPTSCMMGAHLFLDRLLAALAGAAPAPLTATRVPLADDIGDFVRASPPDFTTLVLVRLADGTAKPVLKDSMTVTGASLADGYFAVGPGRDPPKPGDAVPVVLLR